MLSSPHHSGKLARWGQDLNIRYKPGNADALSRACVGDCRGEDDIGQVLWWRVIGGDEVEVGGAELLEMLEADEEVVEMVRLVEEGVLPSSESRSNGRAIQACSDRWCTVVHGGSRPRLVVPSGNQGKKTWSWCCPIYHILEVTQLWTS